MPRLALLIVCALLGALVAVPGASFAQPAPSNQGADGQTIHKDGFAFPSRLADFQRGAMTDYEAQSPGLGFSFSYKAQRAWANVFVYDKKLAVPLDAASERDSALRDIDQFVKNGTYQSAAVISRTTFGPFAKATLRIIHEGKPRDDFAYVTVHKGKFVKVRVSSPVVPGTGKTADNLVSALAQLLR